MMPRPYFADVGFTLYLGDCIPLMDHLVRSSVDMIFADPPYNLSNGGFTCHSGHRVPVHKGAWDVSDGLDEDYSFQLSWISQSRKVLSDTGTIWISGTYHSIYSCGYALRQTGFHLLNEICWFKPNAPPNLSTRYFTASHETLIWARKDRNARHYFNYDLMKTGEWPEDPLKKPGRQMRTVWSIPSPPAGERKSGRHPTQKPCALLRRIISACTHEGDLILDPFCGSSTTGIAAYAMGRKFIGIDSEERYLDISVRRYLDLKDRLAEDRV